MRKLLALLFACWTITSFGQSVGDVRMSIWDGTAPWNTGTWTGTNVVPFLDGTATPVVRSVSGTGAILADSGTIGGFTTTGSSSIYFLQSGSLTVARTVDAKLKDFALSVTDFGAVGDGVTDDTVSIQAALNAAALSTKTRAVMMPVGTFAITSLQIPLSGENQSIALIGQGSTKNNSQGATTLLVTSATTDAITFQTGPWRAKLKDFCLRASQYVTVSGTNSSSTNTGRGIVMTAGTGCAIEGVKVIGFKTGVFGTNVNHVVFRDSQIVDNIGGGGTTYNVMGDASGGNPWYTMSAFNSDFGGLIGGDTGTTGLWGFGASQSCGPWTVDSYDNGFCAGIGQFSGGYFSITNSQCESFSGTGGIIISTDARIHVDRCAFMVGGAFSNADTAIVRETGTRQGAIFIGAVQRGGFSGTQALMESVGDAQPVILAESTAARGYHIYSSGFAGIVSTNATPFMSAITLSGSVRFTGTIVGDPVFSGTTITANSLVASGSGALMNRKLVGDEPFFNLARSFKYVGTPTYGSTGTGSAAASSGAGAAIPALASGTSTSGYGRVTMARGVNISSGLSGSAIQFNAPVGGMFRMALSMAAASETSRVRIVFGGNNGVPATADADALSTRGFGAEIAYQTDQIKFRAFAHDGTTYTAGSWQNLTATGYTGEVILLGAFSDGAGGVTAYHSTVGSRTITSTTITGGPTSATGAGQYVDIAAVNPSTGTPASVSAQVYDHVFMTK